MMWDRQSWPWEQVQAKMRAQVCYKLPKQEQRMRVSTCGACGAQDEKGREYRGAGQRRDGC